MTAFCFVVQSSYETKYNVSDLVSYTPAFESKSFVDMIAQFVSAGKGIVVRVFSGSPGEALSSFCAYPVYGFRNLISACVLKCVVCARLRCDDDLAGRPDVHTAGHVAGVGQPIYCV